MLPPDDESQPGMKALCASVGQGPWPRKPCPAAPASDMKASGIRTIIVIDIAHALHLVLADVAAIYQKTRNYYWYLRGPRARDYLRLLGEQSDELYAMTDEIGEHLRKMGGQMLPSIGDLAGMRQVPDYDAGAHIEALAALAELREDNVTLSTRLRKVRKLCEWYHVIETARRLDAWIDKTQRRKLSLDDAC